jgi:plastocyanin/mono/diheme cytochrome c family protein
VLPVAAFVAFWVVVALGLCFLAVRGGAGRPSRDPGRRGSQMMITLFLVTVAVFGIGLPLLLLTGNHANASAQVSGLKLTSSEKAGRELFGEHCGVCHTLSAANAVGKVGPNLDLLKPSESIVLHTIANGCLPNPPASESAEICLGQGVMPSGVVQDRDARDVAQFVARVTGGALGTGSSSGSGGSSAGSSQSSSSSSSSSASSTTTSASSTSATAPSGKAQTIDIAASPAGLLKFTMASLTAKAGTITFVFTNKSPLPHNLTIQQGTNGKILGATPTFVGGTHSLTVTLTPGMYTYFCSVPGHRQAGMLGMLMVK